MCIDNSINDKLLSSNDEEIFILLASFFSNFTKFSYVLLIIISFISIVLTLCKSNNRKFSIGFILTILGATFHAEFVLLPILNAYMYFPKIFNDLLNKIPTNELNIIVNVGMSGSGKSSIAELFVGHGYKRINSDTQKLTTNACIKLCANYASNNEKIIIDNTNPEKKTRLEYINIAKKYKIPIYCIYYNIDKGICMHNNIYRHLTKNVPIVPKIAYNIFSKKLEIPDINEGFKDIVELNESYANDDPIYKQYLF